MTIEFNTIIQNAYIVNDLEEGMARWNKTFGYGPWLVLPHIDLQGVKYRGEEVEIDISAAFVQAGEVQIELIEQHSDGPSCYRDQFAPGEEGFHHVAIMCDDYDAVYQSYVDNGFPAATEFVSGDHPIAYMDARAAIGSMVELYSNTEGIRQLYQTVRDIQKGWDGKELVYGG